MKLLSCATAMLLVAACNSGEEGDEAPARDGAAANAPAAEAPADDYPPGYAEMKAAAKIFAAENFGAFVREPMYDDTTGEERVHYQVEDCQAPFENVELAELLETDYWRELLAREIAKHDHYLSQLYGRQVFEEPLRAYEQAALKRIDAMPAPPANKDDFDSPESQKYQAWEAGQWELKTGLANAIEERRKRLEPGAIPTGPGGGCGAGEQPYLVKTDPPGGRVWLTTKFSFDLCRAKRLDQWDLKSCRWTELAPDDVEYLSGRYVYQAQWGGGQSKRGIRMFDGGGDGSGETATVTISGR